MQKNNLGLAVAAALLFAPVGARAFPWSTDMFVSPAVLPFEQPPRVMPAGTLPIAGAEPPMPREEAAEKLANPLTPTDADLAHGKALFETNCVPCHGPSGQGNGPIADQTVVRPADLTAGLPVQRTDGYIYGTIRDGSIIMPPYGDAMSDRERWQVVLYVRALQQGRRDQ